jgi:hypothetical protein
LKKGSEGIRGQDLQTRAAWTRCAARLVGSGGGSRPGAHPSAAAVRAGGAAAATLDWSSGGDGGGVGGRRVGRERGASAGWGNNLGRKGEGPRTSSGPGQRKQENDYEMNLNLENMN